MTDLTPEQVLAQLQTRGFETGGFRSPLRHFRGTLTSITGSMVQRGKMPNAKLELSYNFDKPGLPIEVFASTEPYPFPIAQISMMHSTRDKSNTGVLGKSIDKIINAGVDENIPHGDPRVKNHDFLIDKVQEWKVTTGHMMWDNDKQEETPREAWEVVYVEGVGGTPHSGVATTAEAPTPAPAPPTGVTPIQQALNLLDGKTQQEWNNIVFQDLLVKGDASLVNSIISGTFIPPMEASTMVTKDENGVFHVRKD